jgi:mercuric ion transport protein
MTPTPRHSDRGTILASTAALAGAVAASSCCLPLLPFVAAAGFAGSSAFFATLRPYLLGASVLLIAFGFYQAHRAKQCDCRPSKLSTAVLWFSAVVITVTIFFPQAIAALLAG